MSRDATAFSVMAASAVVLGWSVPLAVACLAGLYTLGKTGYVVAMGAVPVIAAFGAALTNRGVARVMWRLVAVGPVVMFATLGALVWAGWPIFSVDTAYWEPPAAGLAVLFGVNSLVLAYGGPDGPAMTSAGSEVNSRAAEQRAAPDRAQRSGRSCLSSAGH